LPIAVCRLKFNKLRNKPFDLRACLAVLQRIGFGF
jgi:hypothetical protein